MITQNGQCQYENGIYKVQAEFYGLSTDAKPTNQGVGNGSIFVEMDTGKLYFFNDENNTWIEWGAEA